MEPYLSIVATSRNDDHGGNLVGRMQAFSDNISVLALRHKVPIEVIIVEWNPPADKPKLKEIVKWPSNEFVTTRIINVSNELHKQYDNSERLPLFQMIGKNVGIRRAKSDFILATNVDVLFPERFFRWLSEKPLMKHVMYRTDRHDVNREITNLTDVDEQLAYCPKNLVALQNKSITTVVSNPRSPAVKLASAGAFAFNLANRTLTVLRLYTRPRKNKKHLDYHVPRLKREIRLPGTFPYLHTNACGDFQLMHIEDWNSITGYYEFQSYSMHLDSMASYAACIAGIREKILPFAVYHIDHTGGWTLQTEKDGSFDTMLKKRGLSYINLDEVEEKLMENVRKPIYANPDNWGLQGVELKEEVI